MIYDKLINELGSISNEKDFSLSALNRYGTGGNADLVIFPSSEEELRYALKLIKGNYNFAVIGGGSNLLISDKGFRGVIISTKNLTKIEIKGSLLTAECGAKLTSVVNEMQNNSFSGLEFSIGIPATVGGAVCMNAGCYSKSVGEKIRYVVTDEKTYSYSECDFSYRKSRFLNSGEVIIKACFNIRPEEQDYIEEKLEIYKSFRKNPKGRNAGSVFKNDGYFAGKIIDEAGLKGYKVGGAKISSEHANFIIAEKGATSTDIFNLIKEVKEKVYKLKQINLTEEIIYFGEF